MKHSKQKNQAAISIRDVCFSYGRGPNTKRALDDVCFRVEVGSFKVLMGINGAGKSTLFSLICHLYSTEQGQIHIFGEDVNKRPTAALKHLGIVFQQQTLEPGLSIVQNLQYYAALQGLSKARTNRRIEELLVLVSLSDQSRETVAKLSGGQRRRVELARALLHSPSLLLMDEATTGLDVKTRYDFIATIRKLCARQKVSVLWATHLVDEVLDDDAITILHQGRVLADSRAGVIIKAQGCDSIQAAFLKITDQRAEVEAGVSLSQTMAQHQAKGRVD